MSYQSRVSSDRQMNIGSEKLVSRPLECAFTPNNQHINI